MDTLKINGVPGATFRRDILATVRAGAKGEVTPGEVAINLVRLADKIELEGSKELATAALRFGAVKLAGMHGDMAAEIGRAHV